MKMKTKLLSYLMAGIMSFMAVFGTNWFSLDAFADSINLSYATITSDNVSIDTVVGVPYTVNTMYAVYLAGDSSELRDAAKGGIDAIIRSIDTAAELNRQLNTYREYAVYIIPYESAKTISESKDPSIVDTFVVSSGYDTSSGTARGEYMSSLLQQKRFYVAGNKSVTIGSYTIPAIGGSWGSIFGSSTASFTWNNNTVTGVGNAVSNNYTAFRNEVNFDSNSEYTQLIKPLLADKNNSMTSQITTLHNNNNPITLIIEPYGLTTMMYNKPFWLSVKSAYNQSSSWWSNGASNPPKYLKNGTTALSWGFYYAYVNQGASIMAPAYNSKYSLNGDVTRLKGQKSTKGNTINCLEGWSYFSLCTKGADDPPSGGGGGTFTPPENIRVNVKIQKEISKEGANANFSDKNVEATFLVSPTNAWDDIKRRVSNISTTSSPAKMLQNAVIDYERTGSYDSTLAGFYAYLQGTVFMPSAGNSYQQVTTSGRQGSTTIILPKANTKYYFFVRETAIIDNNICAAEWAPPSCVVLSVNYHFDKDTGKGYVSWGDFCDLSDFSVIADYDSVPSSATAYCENNSCSITAHNVVRLYDIVPNFAVSSAYATILDKDEYYLNYPAYYGFTNNRQLVYTNEKLLTKPGAPYIAAWGSCESLRSNIITILGLSTSGDKTTLQAVEMGTNTTFKNSDKYSWNFGLLDESANTSFVVDSDDVLLFNTNYGTTSLDVGYMLTLLSKDNDAIIPQRYTGGTVKNVVLDDDDTYPSLDVNTTRKPYCFEYTASAHDLSADNIKTRLGAYADYCKNYSIYEAMVATSAYSAAVCTKYWSALAQKLYASLLDTVNTYCGQYTTCPAYGAGYTTEWNKRTYNVKTAQGTILASYVYDFEYGDKYKMFPRSSAHRWVFGQSANNKWHDLPASDVNYIKNNGLSAWYAHRIEDAYSIVSAADIESKFSSYSKVFEKITGLQLVYSMPRVNYRCDSTGFAHTDAIGTKYHVIGKYDYTYIGNIGGTPWTGVSIGGPTSSEGRISISSAPSSVRTWLTAAKGGSSVNIIGGGLARYVKVASQRAGLLIELEGKRPNAEIHIGSTYEANMPHSSSLYKTGTVPEYLLSQYWENQSPFLKNSSHLSAVLDLQPKSLVSPGYFNKTNSLLIGSDVSNGLPILADTVRHDAYYPFTRNSVSFLEGTGSGIVSTSHPGFAFMSGVTLTYDDVGTVKGMLEASNQVTLSNSNSRIAVRKRNLYCLNNAKLGITALDAIGYLETIFDIYTGTWDIDVSNRFERYLPTTNWDKYIPSSVKQDIDATSLGVKVDIPKIDYVDSPSTVSSVSMSTWVKSYLQNNITGTDIKNCTALYPKGLLPITVSGYLYTEGSYSDNLRLQNGSFGGSDSVWKMSTTPYDIQVNFKSLTPPDTTPKTTVDMSKNTATSGAYTRSGVTYKIVPLVKMAYYKNDVDHSKAYTYIVGQKARELKSHVYYNIGFSSSNADPTVVANAVASSSKAKRLASKLGAAGVPVTYSGTGLTVTYEPATQMVFQSFNLVNADANKSYQADWGNPRNVTSAHAEWLKSLGVKTITGTTPTGGTENKLVLGITAACSTAVTNNRNQTSTAWTLKNKSGIALALYQSAYSALDIRLAVSGGEVTSVTIPKDFTDANGNFIRGVMNANGTKNAAGTGVFTADTTSAMLTALENGNAKVVADALRGVGITGADDDTLKSSFAHNLGTNPGEDFKELRVGSGSNWYNEYCYCLALRVETTSFKLPAVSFTDKIPIELGPTTAANREQYFSAGYKFRVTGLRLKLTGGSGSKIPGVSDTIMSKEWVIPRMDKRNPDLIISDVPITGAG